MSIDKRIIDISSIEDRLQLKELYAPYLIVLCKYYGFDEDNWSGPEEFMPNYQISNNILYEFAGSNRAGMIIKPEEQSDLANEISRNGDINQNIISINIDNLTGPKTIANIISYLLLSKHELYFKSVDSNIIVNGLEIAENPTEYLDISLNNSLGTNTMTAIREEINSILIKNKENLYEKRIPELEDQPYIEENTTNEIENFDLADNILSGQSQISIIDESNLEGINNEIFIGNQEIDERVVFNIDKIEQDSKDFNPNAYLEATKSKTEDMSLTKPYPTELMIQKLKAHKPNIAINSVSLKGGICTPYMCNMPMALASSAKSLAAAIIGVSKKTERRVTRIESALSALMHYFFSTANSSVINCIYYGGQHEIGKPPYKHIRCLDDNLQDDRAIVTIDQCVSCPRREINLGKIYESLDENGINIEELLTRKLLERSNLNDYFTLMNNSISEDGFGDIIKNLNEFIIENKDIKDISNISITNDDVQSDDNNPDKEHTVPNKDIIDDDYNPVSEIVSGVDNYYDDIIKDAKRYSDGDVQSVINHLDDFKDGLLKVCNDYNEDPFLILSIIAVESGGRIDCKTGSYWGLMQAFKDDYDEDKLITDPYYSIEAGVKILESKRKAVDGSDMYSCIAYKSGQGNVLAIDGYSNMKYPEFLTHFKPYLESKYDDNRVWADVVYWTRLTERYRLLKKKIPNLKDNDTNKNSATEWAMPFKATYYKITSDYKEKRYYFKYPNGQNGVTLDRSKAEKYGIDKVSSHTGIDLVPTDKDADILASLGGKILASKFHPQMGYYVHIGHSSGLSSRYCHLKYSPNVKVGEEVIQGQKIGIIGSTGYSTGTHLHFEIKKTWDYRSQTIDPKKYIL